MKDQFEIDTIRESRIKERIKQVGYKNTAEFFKDMIAEADISDDAEQHYYKYKGNYNSSLKGLRSFREKEILAMEKLLGVSFYKLISGEKPQFNPRGVNYAANQDNASLLKFGSDPDYLVNKYDEYDKSLLSYVLEYQSMNLFRYLIDHGFLSHQNFTTFTYSNMSIDYEDESKIVPMLAALNSVESFNKLFDEKQMLSTMQWRNEWMFDDEFFSNFLSEKDNLMLALIEQGPKEFDLKEINRGLQSAGKGKFVSPIPMLLLSGHLHLLAKNEELLRKILEQAIKSNREVIKSINQSKQEYSDLTQEGLIKNGITVVASIYTCSLTSQLNIKSDETKKLIETLNNQSNEIKFSQRDLNGGFSNRKARVEQGNVVKEPSDNPIEYEFLKAMESEGYAKTPKYLGNHLGLDYFSYFEGTTKRFVYEMSDNEIKQVLFELRKIQNISRRLLNGEVYIHGDLSPMNVVFNHGELTGIIDWDGCRKGKDDYYDFIYVFWTWENVGNYLRDNEALFAKLKWMIGIMEPSEEFKSNFADKIIEVMESKLSGLDKESPDYQRIYQWVKWSEVWVEMYRDRIKEEIG